MHDKLGNVSNSSVLKATGRNWDEWVEYIDYHGGAVKSHREIVKMLNESGVINSPWWQQTVTVGYEYAKNRRIVGETASAKFELGVQKTIPMERTQLWQTLFEKDALAIWLGNIESLVLEPEMPFGSHGLPKGKIRSIKDQEKIRMSVQTEIVDHPFTLQIYLMCPRNTENRTSLRFHFEKLESSEERELMRSHYKNVMEQLQSLVIIIKGNR